MQDEDEQTDADTRSAVPPTNKRSRAKGWILAEIVIAAAAIGWVAYSRLETDAIAKTGPAALPPAPQVSVSKPLVRELDSRLGFLGQFSAVEQVELRAQVGGTLTGIHFKDGDIVHRGDLLFTIDARPYEIRLAQANAQLETASARLALANRELHRAEELAAKAFGTEQTVDQRTADRQTAQAAVDDAKAQIREFRDQPPGFETGFRSRKSRSYLRGHSTENSASARG